MNKKKLAGIAALCLAAAAIFLKTRRSIPKGVKAIKPFDIKKYLGKWYEIARFDYRFEKNMINTSAEYFANEDESVRVINRGLDLQKGKFKEAEGKAVFAGNKKEGRLKVSFFWPLFEGYNVIALDPGYNYAMVAGKNKDYLWFLSRGKTMPAEVKSAYLKKARSLGFNTDQLNWIRQE